MLFADRLKQVMVEQGMTQSELAKATRIGRSSISQYLSGKVTPTPERRTQIAEALGVDLSELGEYATVPTKHVEKMTPDEAARILGVNHNTLRKGLQQGVFPWGYAIRTSDSRWTYIINAKKFAEVEGVRV